MSLNHHRAGTLSDEERTVIDHGRGPLLVLGGPGTGKTSLLEQRYLELACREDLAPHRILFLCKDRRYGVEARDRLVWALPHEATLEVPVYTWHSLAFHLVSRYYPSLGYREPPVLLTGPEQWGAVRQLLDSEPAEAWGQWGQRLLERAFVDEVADFCLRVQQRLLTVRELQELAAARPDWSPVTRFFARYQDFMKEQSRVDYAGLIASSVRLLVQDGAVRSALQNRFAYVLVDDAQELSRAQLQLLEQFDSSALTVAADPDCGIESFRGAEPDWVYGFEKWFGPHRTVKLGTSHRVGQPCAEAASRLILHNGPDPGHRVCSPARHVTAFECHLYSSPTEEVHSVAREFRRLHVMEGVPWDQMAVLVSQPRYLLGPLERALEHWEVPFRPMSGDRPISGEPAVGCFLDLVRVVLDIAESDSSLPDVLSSPLCGMDYRERRELEREAWRSGVAFEDLVEHAPNAAEFRKLRDLIIEHQGRADECFWQVYQQSDYYRDLEEAAKADPGHADNAHVEALVAFSHSLARFVERRRGRASIQQYLSEAARADFGGDSWLSVPNRGANGVSIVSFHAAKGREWHTVAVTGCLDAWMPKGRRAQGLFDPFSLETPNAAERQIEAIGEDRRTFYVAATRARSKVIFTASTAGGGRSRPSRFLSEFSDNPPSAPVDQNSSALTISELSAGLRRLLASPDSSPSERMAALLALADSGADPTRWYGRWEWTPGDNPIVQGQLRTSYSRLGLFDNCPLQYVLQSVLGLDPATTYSMKFGTWLHALFQAAHEGKISDRAALVEAYENIFDEKIFPNQTIARQFKKDGGKMLDVFWEKELDRHFYKAEHDFEFPLGPALLRGRIDRIDLVKKAGGGGILKLTDYKTAKWAPSRAEAERSLQLAIYHLAARTDPALNQLGQPEVARLVFPGSLWPSGDHKVITQNAEQADRVIQQLPQMIDKVIDEDFRPSADADCFFCKMKPLCPLWPQGREISG